MNKIQILLFKIYITYQIKIIKKKITNKINYYYKKSFKSKIKYTNKHKYKNMKKQKPKKTD